MLFLGLLALIIDLHVLKVICFIHSMIQEEENCIN